MLLIRELDLYSWSEFYSPLRYACEGGKRIRPLLLVLSVEAIQATNRDSCHVTDDAFMAGSAIELLHTESVIHDDIIDEERLRRGKPSFHIKYGYNSSILTADFVLGIILNIGSKMNNSRVTSELSSAAKMSEGEMMEIRLAKHKDVTEDEYIKVIEHKTASLFEASTKIGAILGDGNEDQIHALGTFGNLLGIAYQIHDDLLDWNNEDRLFNLLVKRNFNPWNSLAIWTKCINLIPKSAERTSKIWRKHVQEASSAFNRLEFSSILIVTKNHMLFRLQTLLVTAFINSIQNS